MTSVTEPRAFTQPSTSRQAESWAGSPADIAQKEFLAFLRQTDRTVAADLEVHSIVDNSSTHKTAEIRDFLERHPRFHFHFTPTGASWFNAVES